MSKKLVLIAIVLVEAAVGSVVLLAYGRQKLVGDRVLGSESVAVIPQREIIKKPTQEFEYYWELKPSSTREDNPDWLPYTATYTINADGLNDSLDYQIEKPPNTYRILALGDSNTYGHYVNTRDNWTEKLENTLNRNNNFCGFDTTEVINLGMPGFGIPYIVERYEAVGKKYDPDLIIWFESGSGFFRVNELMRPLVNACEARPASVSANTAVTKNEFYNCWREAENNIKQTYTPVEIRSLITEHLDKFFTSTPPSKVNFLTFENFRFNEYSPNTFEYWRDRYPDAVFSASVEELQKNERLPDGHPAGSGHQKISNQIYNYLLENQGRLPNCQG